MSDTALDVIAVKAGRLVVFSEGEYSDYGYRGTYVALTDLTWEALTEVAESCKSGESYGDEIPTVEAALIRKGFLMEVDMREIHLGSYGTIEITPH